MRKNLFLVTGCLMGMCFGQTNTLFDVDNDGKIHFQKIESNNPSNPDPNFLNPNDLEIDWSEPDYNLSNNPEMDSWDVRIATQGEDVFVVYNDNHTNGLQKIIFQKKLESGEWSDAIFVDAGGEIGERNNHLPAIASSSNGDLHVVYNVWAYENGRNYIGYSHYDASAGAWVDGVKISDLGGTVDHFNSYKNVYSTEEGFPVVVWGFDNRENSVNEEIYLTYFDGESWSEDIAVSDLTDNQNAGVPHIRSIGNQKAMVVYSENNSDGTSMDLKYRIYDEQSHELSEPKIITSDNVMTINYVPVASSPEQVFVLTYFKMTGPDRDVMAIYNYDINSDTFELSANTFEVPANAGGLLKRVDADCTASGDCGVIYTDFFEQKISYVGYSPETGFGEPVVICNEDPQWEFPSARFDSSGNFHASWSDMRNDPGAGWVAREAIYKMGRNESLGIGNVFAEQISIYPNPAKDVFTIQTDKSLTVEIIDISGRLIDKRMISGTTQIHKSLPSGVYFVRLTHGKEVIVKKLMVK